MDFFIEAGKSLNDKDRNNNHDLVEIQAFFEPIDRLFGDYEIRKKYNLTDHLYRRDVNSGEEIRIDAEEIQTRGRKEILFFFIYRIYYGYAVGFRWENPEKFSVFLKDPSKAYEAKDEDKGTFQKLYEEAMILEMKEREKRQTMVPTVDFLVLDPIKLVQAIDLDEARHISLKRSIIAKCLKNGNDLITQNNEELKPLFDLIDIIVDEFKILRKKEVNPKINDDEIESLITKHENLLKGNKENLEKIIEEFNSNSPLTKLKNFERFNYVRIRLGQYHNGKLVLFLHPYESESNNPIRIPAEE